MEDNYNLREAFIEFKDIKDHFKIINIIKDKQNESVTANLDYEKGTKFVCPMCGK
jgi:rubrerythrin